MTPTERQRMIELLDTVADATWAWEEACHGPHPEQFYGRVVFEAVMELQHWFIEEAGAVAVRVAPPRPFEVSIIDVYLQPDGSFSVERTDIITHRVRLQDDPTLRSLARACFPKEQHDTQGAAEAQMRSITKRGLEKDAAKIHTYECPHCNKWHVGHGQ